jgi:hypothetical protein
MPREFNKIYLQAALEKKAPAPLEMENLGIDHGHLGAWYLEKQGIPPTLCEPVRFHHGAVLENKPHLKHALLIRLADMLALHYRLGQSGNFVEPSDPFLSEEWHTYLGYCHTSDADGKELKQTLIDQVVRISDLVRKIIV